MLMTTLGSRLVSLPARLISTRVNPSSGHCFIRSEPNWDTGTNHPPGRAASSEPNPAKRNSNENAPNNQCCPSGNDQGAEQPPQQNQNYPLLPRTHQAKHQSTNPTLGGFSSTEMVSPFLRYRKKVFMLPSRPHGIKSTIKVIEINVGVVLG